MKTIGLLGGMSWESTALYYQLINQGVRQALGGLHSAKIMLYSVDFHEIEQRQHTGDWAGTAVMLTDAARRLEAAGADLLLICTNTMHKVAPVVESAISMPLLHIADATALALQADGIRRVGLLGTRFTMEQDFYKGRLEQVFGLEVLVPEPTAREQVHRIIYDELCLGDVQAASRARYLDIIRQLQQRGAEAVILGCTEITLLIQQLHTRLPLYDTTAIHARAAVEAALDPA
ncbi:MAG TPA: aspartate/glutamate racemase family protein [Thiolinea sp.]|nr:aspartate/glutamate racemase family protein [Thiolinea sp.]